MIEKLTFGGVLKLKIFRNITLKATMVIYAQPPNKATNPCLLEVIIFLSEREEPRFSFFEQHENNSRGFYFCDTYHTRRCLFKRLDQIHESRLFFAPIKNNAD